MDKPLSLENALLSYKIMIALFCLFIVLTVVLMLTNIKGFNKYLGYEIFVTLPVLLLVAFIVKEIFEFKNNPTGSLLSKFPMASQTWFIPALILLVIIVLISGFYTVLYVGNVFSDVPTENSTAMLINFAVIVLFIVVSLIIYKSYSKRDMDTMRMLPKAIQDAFHLRTKYTLMFLLFLITIVTLYLVNPWNIMSDYGGPMIFVSLFVGITMVIMISVYQHVLSDPGRQVLSGPSELVVKGLYILGAIGVSIGLIYGALKMMGLFNQDVSKPETWVSIGFNLLMFCAMLSIIYKLANVGGFLDKNPYYRLILNTILYIPCLLVGTIDNLRHLIGLAKGSANTFAPPSPFETKMLVVSLLLLGSYFVWFFLAKPFLQSLYLKQGGKQLINRPISTKTLTNVATYQQLSGSDEFTYQYALSFWVYLDAFPPSSDKVAPLLSYGETPVIKYSATKNTLYITVKGDNPDSTINLDANIGTMDDVKSMPFGHNLDADGNRIIYVLPDVQLQKWNHILINYNGGTLDVFYNGRLVKSAIEVVPYMKLDMLTVGSENGASGSIANLMYFKKPLDYLTVNMMYSSLKGVNPPIIPDNPNRLIPLQ